MSIQNPNILKGWFVTLAKPIQDQFWDWIDSFRHKNDKITIDDLENSLKNAINGILISSDYTGTSNFTNLCAAKTMINAIAIVPSADMTIKIGTTPNGNEVLEDLNVFANTNEVVVINKYFHANTTIYITGITANVFVKFFKAL